MNTEHRSVTFTALIFTGIVVALAGVLILLFGLGGATVFAVSIGDFSVSTTSVGLAVLAVGALLAAAVAMHLPENVQVFGPTPRGLPERLRALTPLFLVLALIALIGSILSVVH